MTARKRISYRYLAAVAALIATGADAKSNDASKFSGKLVLFQHSSNLTIGKNTYRVRLASKQSQRVFGNANIDFRKISCFKISGRGRASSNTDEIGVHLFNIEQIFSMHRFPCKALP
ncbi:hypothetical protein [Novosphingobium clariflavum]|uniref:Uncharacterized protein n=1 Tax=Novosphingobium clariflavum TaxID=2029884 RepID=A0ABV6S7T1_9SPHN|nr:hypothetical protein [Novosphingobium clariflavum]